MLYNLHFGWIKYTQVGGQISSPGPVFVAGALQYVKRALSVTGSQKVQIYLAFVSRFGIC